MGSDVHQRPFEFIVSDTFLIEGRGLILCPFFSLGRYQFGGKEHLLIETPDGTWGHNPDVVGTAIKQTLARLRICRMYHSDLERRSFYDLTRSESAGGTVIEPSFQLI